MQLQQTVARPQLAARTQIAAAAPAFNTQPAGQTGVPAQQRHAARRTMRAVSCSAASPAAGETATKVVESGLPRTAVVGVLGGGQLGKMLGQEAVSGGRRRVGWSDLAICSVLKSALLPPAPPEL